MPEICKIAECYANLPASLAFVPLSWNFKKQTTVSHRRAEPEIISVDASLRMQDIATLQRWDCSCQKHFRFQMTRETIRAQMASVIHYLIPLIACHLMWLATFQATFQGVHFQPDLTFEDSEADIRMIIKRAADQNLRHVSRTQRVDLDQPFKRISLGSSMSMRYVGTTEHSGGHADHKSVHHHSLEVCSAVLRRSSTTKVNVDRSFSE